MPVMKKLKQDIARMESGTVFSYNDLKFSESQKGALAKALSRLTQEGVIQRLSKGKYYKPRKTRFGDLPPAENQIIDKCLTREGKTRIGYESGINIYRKLGLTNQISNEIIIATSKLGKSSFYFNNIRIRFIRQKNTITDKNIYYLQLLDALKEIKKIQDSDLNQSLRILKTKLQELDPNERKRMISLAKRYNPATRALFGALLESIGESPDALLPLRRSLNSLTRFILKLDPQILPNKALWQIA